MTAMTRQALSREVIAAAALDLTDREGLAGLSMRKLGSVLGVEAMSLYHYVSSKDDLLDAVVDQLCGEIELPSDGSREDDEPLDLAQWREEAFSALRSFYEVLRRHPAAVELIANRPVTGLNGFIVLYWAHRKCAALGLTPAQASDMVSLVVAYVIGVAASEVGMMSRLRENTDALDAMTDDPEVIEFFRCSRMVDHDKLFKLGLHSLLDGLLVRYQVG